MTGPYRLEFKAAPGAAPAPVAAPGEVDESLPDAQEKVAQHEWAGDLFDDAAAISDPAEAFASLKGTEGEEAWLDRAEDGTLTAWVRDADGSVYRYSDPDSWAVDVDAAKMARVASNLDDGRDETEVEQDPSAGAEVDPAVQADPADPTAVADPADPAAQEDPLGEPVEDELAAGETPEQDPFAAPDQDEDPTEDPTEDPAEGEQLDGKVGAEGEDDAAASEEPAEGEEEDEDKKKKGNPFGKGKVEGKSITTVGGYRFVLGGRA